MMWSGATFKTSEFVPEVEFVDLDPGLEEDSDSELEPPRS